MEGTVKFFNRIKGFGFIKGDDEKEYFVHLSGIKDKGYLNEGDKVSFEPMEDAKGLKAKDVEILSHGEVKRDSSRERKVEAPKEETGEGDEEDSDEEEDENEEE